MVDLDGCFHMAGLSLGAWCRDRLLQTVTQSLAVVSHGCLSRWLCRQALSATVSPVNRGERGAVCQVRLG